MSKPSLTLSFRAAAAGDLPEITQLYDSAFSEFVDTRGTYFHFVSVLHNPRLRMIVAETEDNRFAGFALMNADNTAVPGALNVDVVAVGPEYRRHGIGRQLMEQAEKLGLKNRFNAVTLQVHEKNAPAIALYKDMGYTQTGKTSRYYRDGAGAFQLKKTLAPEHAPEAWKVPLERPAKTPRR